MQHSQRTKASNRNVLRVLVGFLVLNTTFLAFILINSTGFATTLGAGHIETGSWQSNDIDFQDVSWAGSGTAGDPFQIGTPLQLAYLAYRVNGGRFEVTGPGGTDFHNQHFALTADIDLSKRQWVAIGGVNRPFRGGFDGRSHKITLPQVLRAEVMTSDIRNYGLFGLINGATITDLIVDGEVLYYSTTHASDIRIGSVVGTAENSQIHNVASFVRFDLDYTTSGTTLGGLVGVAERTLSVPVLDLFNLANHGDIVTGSVRSAGGIVGAIGNRTAIVHSGNEIVVANIFNSYNRGNITVSNLAVTGGLGGILGEAVMTRQQGSSPRINITNVFNSGALSVGNATTHVRMRQIHGHRTLDMPLSYNGQTSNWILSVNNAFGARHDSGFVQSEVRFVQNHINTGLINNVGVISGGTLGGLTLLAAMQLGRSEMPPALQSRAHIWQQGDDFPSFPLVYSLQGNLQLVLASAPFGIAIPVRNFFVETGTLVAGQGLLALPDSFPNNIEFMGFATSADLALAGVVAFPYGESIEVTLAHTNSSPLSLHAVYRFVSPVILTVNTGDDFFVASTSSISVPLVRPNDYAGLLSRRTSERAVHVGWATTQARALDGIIDFTPQPNPNRYFFRENTQLFAVWNRISPASIVLTVSNAELGIHQPSHLTQFSSARVDITLSDFTPTIPQGFLFRGWARSAEDAARRAVAYRANQTPTFSQSTNLYAVWVRMGDPGTDQEPTPLPPGEEPGSIRLETPEQLAIVGTSLLVWSAIDHAIGYAIYINDARWTVVMVNFIDLNHFTAGIYRIRIRAIGGGSVEPSEQSTQLRHVIGGATQEAAPPAREEEVPESLPEGVTRLSAPAAVRKVGETVAVWESATNAVQYAVYLNGVLQAYTDSTHWEISDVTEGTHIISVRALGDGNMFRDSSLSAGTVFAVDPATTWFTTSSGAWWQNEVVIFAMVGLLVILALSILVTRGQLRKSYRRR